MDHLLLVEDDAATRDWLVGLLADQPDLRLGLACGSVAEARDWLVGHHADIVLTDLGLPDGSGLEVIRLASRKGRCEILVLSIFGDEANVLAALDAGASGYLLKDGNLDAMSEHLACLRSGGSPLSPRIARTLVRRLHGRARNGAGAADATPAGPLSQRELDVLTGIGKGFSYAEVAAVLGVTANTVRTHVRRIYGKLAVHSATEALYEYHRLANDQGLPPLR